MDGKGKVRQVAGTDSSSCGKTRKRGGECRDEGLRLSKRKNPAVLQLFEKSAEFGYYGGRFEEDCDVYDFLADMIFEGQDEYDRTMEDVTRMMLVPKAEAPHLLGSLPSILDWSAWRSKFLTLQSQQPTVPNDNTSTSGGWNSWGKTPAPEASTVGGLGDAGASKAEASTLRSWGKDRVSCDGNKQEEDSIWSNESSQKKEESSWGKKVGSDLGFGKGDGECSWVNKDGYSSDRVYSGQDRVYSIQKKGSSHGGSVWGNQGGGFSSGEKKDGSSGWNKSAEASNANIKGVTDWAGGSSWGGGSPWGKPDGGSSRGKKDDGNGGSSRGKKYDGNGGSSRGKKDDGNGGSSRGKKDDGNGGSSRGKKYDEGSSRGKKDDSVVKVDVFLDLETRKFVKNMKAILEEKQGRVKYILGDVSAYGVRGQQYFTDELRAQGIDIDLFYQRKLFCRGECRVTNTGRKTPLLELEMLVHICVHALRQQRGSGKGMMILSNDWYFSDKIAEKLRSRRRGKAIVFTDWPRGMKGISLYQTIRNHHRCRCTPL